MRTNAMKNGFTLGDNLVKKASKIAIEEKIVAGEAASSG
jgi:hypothetical protein